jgi:hypothetical protein
MQAPIVKREGEAWTFTWEEINLRVRADFSHEDDNGFYAEMHITDNAANPYHIYRGRLNLLAPDSKSRLAKSLTIKLNKIQWDSVLETVSEGVIEDYRKGNPVVRLDEHPQPEAARHLIRPVIPFGETTVMFASGGSGKSLLAMAMAVAVAANQRIPCGFMPQVQSRVLYVDWETSADEQYERIQSISAGLGVRLPGVYYQSLYRPLAEDIKRVRETVDRNNIGFIVLDSLAPACGGDPNNAENTIRFFNALRSLGSGVSRLVVAHTSKENAQKESGRATAYGSVFIENLARSVWEVRRSEDDSADITLGMFHRKVNRGASSAPLGIRIRFDGPKIFFEWHDLANDPQLAAFGNLAYRIRLALKQGARSIESLADELETREIVIAGTLTRMKGVAKLSGKGSSAIYGLLEYKQGGFT